jgi:hypothetical protein
MQTATPCYVNLFTHIYPDYIQATLAIQYLLQAYERPSVGRLYTYPIECIKHLIYSSSALGIKKYIRIRYFTYLPCWIFQILGPKA